MCFNLKLHTLKYLHKKGIHIFGNASLGACSLVTTCHWNNFALQKGKTSTSIFALLQQAIDYIMALSFKVGSNKIMRKNEKNETK
jgi:hypothetical protein